MQEYEAESSPHAPNELPWLQEEHDACPAASHIIRAERTDSAHRQVELHHPAALATGARRRRCPLAAVTGSSRPAWTSTPGGIRCLGDAALLTRTARRKEGAHGRQTDIRVRVSDVCNRAGGDPRLQHGRLAKGHVDRDAQPARGIRTFNKAGRRRQLVAQAELRVHCKVVSVRHIETQLMQR
eukprot:scaffold101032_cov28-Tisochrysis_lutea.AAC.6